MEHHILCTPKCVGGLGITNLEFQNIGLLRKWLFKLLNEDVAWQNLLRNKYLKNKTLAQAVHKPGDSQFWAGLMDIKDPFFTREKFIVFLQKERKIYNTKWKSNQVLVGSLDTERLSNETISVVTQHLLGKKIKL